MELQLQLVCPECHATLLRDFIELAPGRLSRCSNCQTPLRLTRESLERFRRDLRTYCES